MYVHPRNMYARIAAFKAYWLSFKQCGNGNTARTAAAQAIRAYRTNYYL